MKECICQKKFYSSVIFYKQIVKQGFSDGDTFEELYKKDGTPVTIFWSSVAGTRSLIVFAAVNASEVPDTAVAEYTLDYSSNLKPEPKLAKDIEFEKIINSI